MKILYHHRIRSKDGQFVHVEELVHALREAGHEVILVGPRRIEAAGFGADGGIVARLKRMLPGAIYELLELAYSIPAFVWLLRQARACRPDVIYERYNLLFPAGAWVKKLLRLPLLLEVNAPLYEERSQFGGLALPRLAAWSERYVWRAANYVLVVTGVLGKRVQAAGVPAERVAVIPNGINPKRFDLSLAPEAARERLGLKGKCVLGFTGFVRSWHGIDRVIEFIAAERNPDLHLVLVGEGPALPELRATAQRLQVQSQVTFAGLVSRDDVAAYVAAFDVALQPAVVEYASPLKLFEYMALGKAIVAPDSENIREVLEHGRSALLFAPGSPDSLSSALRALCADLALRDRLGAGASDAIRERGLTWGHNAERVADLARTAAANSGSRAVAAH